MNLGYRWVLNQKDLKNCTLLLKRLQLPKDIRTYMRKFMYDWVCPCNTVFYELRTWSKEQARIYEAFQNNPVTIVGLPTNCGKTTLIQGIAEACVKNNVSVTVISSTVVDQMRMRRALGRDNEKLVVTSQKSAITRQTDVVLVDDCDKIEANFVDTQIIPKLARLLCIGKMKGRLESELKRIKKK